MALVQNANVTHREGIRAQSTIAFGDAGTVTAAAGAATLNKQIGVVTTAALTTAAAASYTLTLTNDRIAATSVVLASVATGTNTTAGLVVDEVTPGAGSATIVVTNRHASSALDGTIVISYAVLS